MVLTDTVNDQESHQLLNPRHRAFACLVAEGQSATEAYLAVGYRSAKRTTLHRNAARLRCQPNVRAYILILSREGEELAREATTFTIARKLEFLARLVLTGAGAAKPDDDFVAYHREYLRLRESDPDRARRLVERHLSEKGLSESEIARQLCEAFVTKASTEDAVRFHHSYPKYLGGEVQQILEPLPKSVHDAFHNDLDKLLPRQKGTSYYDGLSPTARENVLRDLGDYKKSFDAKYGTQLYDAMVREGFSY